MANEAVKKVTLGSVDSMGAATVVTDDTISIAGGTPQPLGMRVHTCVDDDGVPFNVLVEHTICERTEKRIKWDNANGSGEATVVSLVPKIFRSSKGKYSGVKINLVDDTNEEWDIIRQIERFIPDDDYDGGGGSQM